MSVQRRASERSQAKTLVRQKPVHVRRWTSRPRAVEAGARAWRPISRRLRRGAERLAAWLQAALTVVGSRGQAVLLHTGAFLLERRRSGLLRELGTATYARDRAGSRRARKQVEELDAEVARRKASAEAVRAEGARQARELLDSSRRTEVWEADASTAR